MTTEEMKSEISHLKTLVESVPCLIKMRDKLECGKERQAIIHALDEILGGRPTTQIEVARWYRDHAKERDSNMTEALNWYSDYLACPTNKDDYPQYWGEAKSTVNDFHPGSVK